VDESRCEARAVIVLSCDENWNENWNRDQDERMNQG
jgi:hypothetical protein